MEDISFRTFSRQPQKRTELEYHHSESQTENLNLKDATTEPISFPTASTQTENDSTISTINPQIRQNSISMLDRAFSQLAVENRAIQNLERFQIPRSVRLQLIRSTPITALPADSLPIQSIIASSTGKYALLCAAPSHETWCSHLAHIVIVQYGKQFSIPLAICPSAAAWGTSGTLAVATVDGNVHLLAGSNIIFVAKLHTFPITCMNWNGNELITASTDGTISFSSTTSANIKQIETFSLPITNESRRKVGAKCSAIASMSRSDEHLIIATETGDLWSFDLSAHTFRYILNFPTAIDCITHTNQFEIAILDNTGGVALVGIERRSVEKLPCEGKYLASLSELLLVTDENILTILHHGRREVISVLSQPGIALAPIARKRIVLISPKLSLDQYDLTAN